MNVGIGWLPTAENINALPDPVRKYIHDLETNADPAGIIRENTIARDTVQSFEAWVNDLQAGCYINCVYCGHRYGPREEEIPADALAAHIAACPKHPMSALAKAADRLASSKGHDGQCRFTGCTCGAVEEQKAALSDYWKLRRVGQ